MSKREQLIQLAQKRKETCWPGYKGIGDYSNGQYECDHVSPYTKSASNLDARIMIVLQDWCSDDFLKKRINHDLIKYGYSPSLPTNQHLKQLLQEHFGLELADTYATNLFPFIKVGEMNTHIPMNDLKRAAQ